MAAKTRERKREHRHTHRPFLLAHAQGMVCGKPTNQGVTQLKPTRNLRSVVSVCVCVQGLVVLKNTVLSRGVHC